MTPTTAPKSGAHPTGVTTMTIYPHSGHGGVFQYHREFVPAVLEFLER